MGEDGRYERRKWRISLALSIQSSNCNNNKRGINGVICVGERGRDVHIPESLPELTRAASPWFTASHTHISETSTGGDPGEAFVEADPRPLSSEFTRLNKVGSQILRGVRTVTVWGFSNEYVILELIIYVKLGAHFFGEAVCVCKEQCNAGIGGGTSKRFSLDIPVDTIPKETLVPLDLLVILYPVPFLFI